MALRVTVDHLTEYRYDSPVSFGEHSLYLRPRESQTLRVSNFSLDTVPSGRLRWVRDCFNNVVAVVSLGLDRSDILSFHCKMAFDVAEENPFDFILDARAIDFPFPYDDKEKQALEPYLGHDDEHDDRLHTFVRDTVGSPAGETVAILTSMNQAIFREFRYERRDDEGVQTPAQTLDRRSGSCRDMAELFVAATRCLGLASRFVSGYLHEPPSDGERDSKNRAAGSMHAWAEVYLPGAGWRGFDPTNGILTDHHFVTAAVANHPEWVNPIQGKYYHEHEVGSQMRISLRVEGCVP